MENTREVVELLCSCTEGNKGDIIAMQSDMIKAYGKDYVKKTGNKKLDEEFTEALEFALKNKMSIPKNINIERFLKRIESFKNSLKEKAEEKEKAGYDVEGLAEFETAKQELEEEVKAFETVKADFAQEKLDFAQLEKDFEEKAEIQDKKDEELTEREEKIAQLEKGFEEKLGAKKEEKKK